MQPQITLITLKSREYPSCFRDKKDRALFPQIWALGDVAILQKPLLGLFCSVKCPGDLILRTYDLARALRDAGVPVVSGFHTPIEKDCLDLLLRGSQPVVVCPARSTQNMRLSKILKAGVEEKRVLFLSPFEEKLKRPTSESSLHRNHLVGILSAAVFVAYAEPGGRTEEFCSEVLNAGKPLYTFQSTYNGVIIEKGAIPVGPEMLARWASSLNDVAFDGQ
jgi:predicted Rossmann fold nucleotide-binding protein DprA/Smf involved in DNA uptake